MKPFIGITISIDEVQYKIRRTYAKAVEINGGLPILFTMETCNKNDIKQLLNHVDGIILSGGGDIDSKYFKQPLNEKAKLVLPIRDEFELLLCKKAIELNKPILAICRGMQILNVALGGQLHQHIENHQFNTEEERNKEIHSVSIKENTILKSIINIDKLMVNSIHHQALSNVSDELIISAIADDNIIEAVEMPNESFVIGIQWHPEAMNPNSIHNNIFKSLIEASRNNEGRVEN